MLHIGGGEIPQQLLYTTVQCIGYMCVMCDKVANKHITSSTINMLI